ncbi:hypothetical protein FisN_8Hu037 [Fistulifera solaris]|uniref:Uncharacterized protein n=1 Tax=Fistulifera solaris TaxID=1519565 RepID=A0A1Z5JJD7_FISSO|nr:hypothetical protein FisN_8Hu037 [Fistulifera solaris]|eukprot:GAX14125.1 hypothetical protein FisN_8Hu037 [Fistulifera solaris]
MLAVEASEDMDPIRRQSQFSQQRELTYMIEHHDRTVLFNRNDSTSRLFPTASFALYAASIEHDPTGVDDQALTTNNMSQIRFFLVTMNDKH